MTEFDPTNMQRGIAACKIIVQGGPRILSTGEPLRYHGFTLPLLPIRSGSRFTFPVDRQARMFLDQQSYMISHVGPMEIDEIPHLGRRLQICDGWGRGKEARAMRLHSTTTTTTTTYIHTTRVITLGGGKTGINPSISSDGGRLSLSKHRPVRNMLRLRSSYLVD